MPIDHPTTAARDLYAAILREPAEDLPRLAYADELDAAGECERAEFIRAQINGDESYAVQWMPTYFDRVRDYPEMPVSEWNDSFATRKWANDLMDIVPDGAQISSHVKWRRGFPSSVAMTMQAFVGGGECRNCGGAGDVLHPTHYRQPCKECGDGKTNGSGRTPGLASVICAQWPVTSIRLVDREPYGSDQDRAENGTGIGWQREEITNPIWGPHNFIGVMGRRIQYGLPKAIFNKMQPNKRKTTVGFQSSAAAHLALSHAAVAYARELAGLPELKWMTNANNPLLDGPADRPVYAGNRPNDRLSGPRLSQ